MKYANATSVAFLLLMPLTGCTTTSEDVAKTEAIADEKTEEAYNAADERALKAQDVAEEKTIQAVDEADRKIEAALRQADIDTEKAYQTADSIEAKQDKRVEITRQKQFVSDMSSRLSSRKKEIKALADQISKESASDRARDEPRLAALRDAQHAAEDLLNKVKKADWREWTVQKAALQSAFGQLDDHLSETKVAR